MSGLRKERNRNDYLREKRSISKESESKCSESSCISKVVSASSNGGTGFLRPLGVIEPHILLEGEKILRGVDGPVRCPEEVPAVGRFRPKPKPKFKFWLESKRASRESKAGKSGAPSMLLLVTNRTGI